MFTSGHCSCLLGSQELVSFQSPFIRLFYQRLSWFVGRSFAARSYFNFFRNVNETSNRLVNKRCFISKCNYGKENEIFHIFSVAKLCLNEWQVVVLKTGLSVKSKICHQHFEDSCIIKGKVIQNVFYAFQNGWRLLPNAKPSLHLGKQMLFVSQ